METKNIEHKKILIDNSICKRRFHLVYEENAPTQEHVSIKCPHCFITLFEANQHPQVLLAREENLVQAPNGSAVIVDKCDFNSKKNR